VDDVDLVLSCGRRSGKMNFALAAHSFCGEAWRNWDRDFGMPNLRPISNCKLFQVARSLRVLASAYGARWLRRSVRCSPGDFPVQRLKACENAPTSLYPSSHAICEIVNCGSAR
jgi:hypothetical protein